MPRTTATQRQISRNFVSCLQFLGSSNRIDLPTAASLNITGAITQSCWIRTYGTGMVYMIVGYQRGGAFPGYGFRLNNGIPEYYAGSGWVASSGTTKVRNGQWNFVSCVLATTTVSFYVNGTLHGTGTSNVPNSWSGTRLIGYDGGTGFTGLLDDVRIYNTNLSGTDLINLYYGLEPATTNLVGWWKLDEGSGTTAIDSSPIGTNTGTITGATYSTGVFTIPRTTAGDRITAGTRIVVS